MKQIDRARLTKALREHVAKIAVDLRAKMRAPGVVRERARRLHADEQVAEDFDVWTDLLSRRAAVLWVLKSVYVRVLEDRGLLSPGRLLDPEAQQLFERLAPHLGESAFLRWVYRDLASQQGGLPELFSPQPAEVALPSDELSRALISFWRHRDADTELHWNFADEKFEGELMGDLYQELDPVVKERFALCQTPDFVRGFILDRTLTPAMETFGATKVRLLDPASGSGHFLIDGLKRLVTKTAQENPDWDRKSLVTHCLERVVGVDLNDYACALARARLVMTAAELAGVATLAEAARFHPHVYWADGLEQVERGTDTRGQQLDLLDPSKNGAPKASLTRHEVRATLRKVLEPGFHAVLGNPPYIIESDEQRKAYHREQLGKKQRYVSAFRLYSLGAPFTERAFQLAVEDGYVGLITADSFMKRVFGRPLVEQFLRYIDLTLVVDTSKADVLQRDSTTVLLFGRNRRPALKTVRTVMGRRGETDAPTDPASSSVWSSIVQGWTQPGFENDFVTVADLPRELFDSHPWSLSGGGAVGLLEKIEKQAKRRLQDVALDIGRTMHTGLDDAFFIPASMARRWENSRVLPLVRGEGVRDWLITPSEMIVFPYDSDSFDAVEELPLSLYLHLWRTKFLLSSRVDYGKSMRERGLRWFEWSMFFKERLRTRKAFAFPVQATHNHFCPVTERAVFNSKAPLVMFDESTSEKDVSGVVGVLNSSVTAFWMRQKFQPRGGQSTGKKAQSEEWSRRLEVDATKLKRAPLISDFTRASEIASVLASLSSEFGQSLPGAFISADWDPASLKSWIENNERRCAEIRARMISLQEELDWTVYVAFSFASKSELRPLEDVEPIASEHRPFAIRLARAAANGGATHYWFDAMGVQPSTEIPTTYASSTQQRIQQRLALLESSDELSLLESPEYKRKWEPIDFKKELENAASGWLADRIEDALKGRSKPVSPAHIVSIFQDDPRFLAVAGVYQGRRDVDLTRLVLQILAAESVPNHPRHIYTESGLTKRTAWEGIWELQRREDAGEKGVEFPFPTEYSQGSRGKPTDFLADEYWKLRGKFDVPKERFIAFTEVPGRNGAEIVYGWAGWTPVQRLKALLAIDEELEDAGILLADRAGLLDSAWRLLSDAACEDAVVANRLKAELQALVGVNGPSKEMIEDWGRRFLPPGNRSRRSRPAANQTQGVDADDDDNN